MGYTLEKVCDILNLRESAGLTLCTLLDVNLLVVKCKWPVEWVGFEIPDEFVVGYCAGYATPPSVTFGYLCNRIVFSSVNLNALLGSAFGIFSDFAAVLLYIISFHHFVSISSFISFHFILFFDRFLALFFRLGDAVARSHLTAIFVSQVHIILVLSVSFCSRLVSP